MLQNDTQILLTDNGSMRVQATLRLRALAKALSKSSGYEIAPVSLQHANKIDKEFLDHRPAQILYDFLAQKLESGIRSFVILPLFFGLSRALTSFIPEQKQRLVETYGEFELKLADVLYPLPDGDEALTDIMLQNIQTLVPSHKNHLQVVVVDHGSPSPSVTEVRNRMVQSLQQHLGDSVMLEQAVMERREGKAYDFNGQLLSEYLHNKAQQGVTDIIVSMMFLLPGRHAGEGGDIETICNRVRQEFPALNIQITDLVADHPQLITLLHERLTAALNAK